MFIPEQKISVAGSWCFYSGTPILTMTDRTLPQWMSNVQNPDKEATEQVSSKRDIINLQGWACRFLLSLRRVSVPFLYISLN